MSNVFLIMFGAILAENFVFTKLFATRPFFGVSSKLSTALGMDAIMTIIMTATSAATFGLHYYVLLPTELEHFKTIAFVIVIALLALIVDLIAGKLFSRIYDSVKESLPLVTVNSAVLGVALINVQNQSTFTDSVLFGVASGLGFTLASVIFAGVRAKLALSEPPKAFKGVPLLLIAAGLVALAFSGFHGMKFN